jgi:hypothetical protein
MGNEMVWFYSPATYFHLQSNPVWPVDPIWQAGRFFTRGTRVDLTHQYRFQLWTFWSQMYRWQGITILILVLIQNHLLFCTLWLTRRIMLRLSTPNRTHWGLPFRQLNFIILGYLMLINLNSIQPWLLSNIIDTETSQVPAALREFEVVERAGIRVGVIGLVERWAHSYMLVCGLSSVTW